MLSKPIRLFSSDALIVSQQYELAGLIERVANISQDEFEANSVEVLTSAILGDLFIAPLQLADENAFVQSATLNGNQLQVEIPYAGGHHLWHVRPNFSNSLELWGAIDTQRSVLVLSYQNPNNTGVAWCQQEFQKRLALIRQYISYQTTMLAELQAKLPLRLQRAIDLRKQKLNA